MVDPAPLGIPEDHAAYEEVKGQVMDPSGQHQRRPCERARDVFERVELAQDAGQERRDERDVDDGDAELNDVAVNERAGAVPAGRQNHHEPGDGDRNRDDPKNRFVVHWICGLSAH